MIINSINWFSDWDDILLEIFPTLYIFLIDSTTHTVQSICIVLVWLAFKDLFHILSCPVHLTCFCPLVWANWNQICK